MMKQKNGLDILKEVSQEGSGGYKFRFKPLIPHHRSKMAGALDSVFKKASPASLTHLSGVQRAGN